MAMFLLNQVIFFCKENMPIGLNDKLTKHTAPSATLAAHFKLINNFYPYKM